MQRKNLQQALIAESARKLCCGRCSLAQRGFGSVYQQVSTAGFVRKHLPHVSLYSKPGVFFRFLSRLHFDVGVDLWRICQTYCSGTWLQLVHTFMIVV